MIFAFVFAILMAWAPPVAVLTQTVRIRSMTEGTREAGRIALRRTVLIALAFTAAAIAAAFGLEDAPAIPYVIGGSAFHIGWWIGAFPLMKRNSATIAAEAGSRPEPARRVASLVVRDEEAILPRRFWALPVAVLLLSAGVVAWAAMDGRIVWGTRAWLVANLWLGALLFLGGWGLWAFKAARARQDLSAATDPNEVDRLCGDFRRFVVRSLFVVTTLAVSLFAAAAAAVAVWGNTEGAGRIGGYAGGSAGALIGVLGAVFGVLADRRRRAIIELGGTPPDATFTAKPRADDGRARTV